MVLQPSFLPVPDRPAGPTLHSPTSESNLRGCATILFCFFGSGTGTVLYSFFSLARQVTADCSRVSSSHVKTRGCGAARGRHEGAASAGGPSAFQQACPGRGSCWGSPSRAACCSRVRPRFPSLEAASCRGLQVGEMGARGVLGLVLAVLGVAAALAPASSGQCALHRA